MGKHNLGRWRTVGERKRRLADSRHVLWEPEIRALHIWFPLFSWVCLVSFIYQLLGLAQLTGFGNCSIWIYTRPKYLLN